MAALEAEKTVLTSRITSAPEGKKGGSPPAPQPASDDPGLAQLNYDLAEALRAKGTLQTRIKKAEDELADLRNKVKSDARLIKDITAERTALATKLKDREHELREKRKLVEVGRPCLARRSTLFGILTLSSPARRTSRTR